MYELQTGVEAAFAVLPQSSVFLQPQKAALDYPALGQNLEGVQLAALGNLHRDVLTQARGCAEQDCMRRQRLRH